jgi:D-alanyl-D-alanine dipeptidase
VSDRLAALTAVAQQASALAVSDAPAADLVAQVHAYEQMDAARRQQVAGPLLDALERGRLQVKARVDDARGLDAPANAAARMMGCPTDVLALLNRRTEPLSPSCAPGFRASVALDRMMADMRSIGLHPLVVSAYRSYQTQAALYQARVRAQGAAVAGEFTAPPGYSEHQLGLAVDLSSSAAGGRLSGAFDGTPEGRWLHANAARYGFILRYPAGKEAVTGYAFEPWHFRYVGASAQSIPAGTTLEEYLA